MKTKEEREAKKTYNAMAREYHSYRTKEHPQGWFYNEMLEMPSTLVLLGNVKGKKILDFGCGSGIYANILTKGEAKLKGFDISKEMLKIAKENNPDLDLRLGSGYKIPFKEKFDVVLAPLSINYLDDWNKVFKEVSRVLEKKGSFIFSVGNPVVEIAKKSNKKGRKLRILGIKSYFDEGVYYEKWTLSNRKIVKIPSYHKTYETIIKTIIKNRFEIVDYKDTYPIRKSKKLFPKQYELCSKIPYFCVWKVRKK